MKLFYKRQPGPDKIRYPLKDPNKKFSHFLDYQDNIQPDMTLQPVIYIPQPVRQPFKPTGHLLAGLRHAADDFV